jgi:hypothetical protein
MSGSRRVNWTDIEITDEDSSANNNEANKFRLNLEEQELEQENNNGKSKNSIERVENKEVKKDEDEEDFTKEAEDKGRRTQREEASREAEVDDDHLTSKRAHKRIKSLLGRVNEKDAIIAEQARAIEELSKRNVGFRKQSAESLRSQWKTTVEQKEAELEKAIAEDDPKAIVKATKELSDAQMRHAAFEAVDDEAFEEQETPRLRQPQQAPPEVPDAAREWIARNKWFNQDEKKHVIARMLSAELTKEGELDPEGEEYWEELDKRLEDYNIKPVPPKGREREQQEDTPAPRRKGSPVSSRQDEDSGGYSYSNDKQFVRSGNRVTANPTKEDVDMADRLGVDLTSFMKEKHKYAQQGYKGYVTIDVPGQ